MPTPLHSPHLPARREQADFIFRQLLFSLRGRSSVAVCFEACAGRRIRWLCLPAVPCSAGFCLPATLCLPCPLPSSVCPRSFASVCFALFISMCARIISLSTHHCTNHHVCKLLDCPVGSCNTGLQWRPVHRSICDSFTFFLQSP